MIRKICIFIFAVILINYFFLDRMGVIFFANGFVSDYLIFNYFFSASVAMVFHFFVGVIFSFLFRGLKFLKFLMIFLLPLVMLEAIISVWNSFYWAKSNFGYLFFTAPYLGAGIGLIFGVVLTNYLIQFFLRKGGLKNRMQHHG